MDATRDGGGGVYIRYTDEETLIPVANGRFSTNFRAEAEAMRIAAAHVREHKDKAKEQVVIFSDAQSVLSALKDSRRKEMNELASTLADIATQVYLALQWIPAHCGIHGNETADRLAKGGGQLDQENTEVTYDEEKTIIKALSRKRWHQQHPHYDRHDSYHQQGRADQVIL